MPNRPKKPKPPPRKPPKGDEEVSAAHIQFFVECLQRGKSWFEAVQDTFGLPPGPASKIMGYRLRADLRVREAMKAMTAAPALPAMEDVFTDLKLAREYAVSNGDGGLLVNVAMSKARLHGLIRSPEEIDKDRREFETLTQAQQNEKLSSGLGMLEALSKKLRDRGLALGFTITDAPSESSPVLSAQSPAPSEAAREKTGSGHPATQSPSGPATPALGGEGGS